MNKKRVLYIGRLLRQFLREEGGAIDSLEIDCCVKEQSGGAGDIYSKIPSHLPKDIDVFHVTNIFKKAEMLPLAGGKWQVENILEIKKMFADISAHTIDLGSIYKQFLEKF